MLRVAASALLLALSGAAGAQVDIETLRGAEGTSGSARISLTGDLGNVDAVHGDGAGSLAFTRESGTLLAVLKGAAGFLGGKRFANSGVLHLRYTFTGWDRIHPEGFLQGDYARSRRLDARTLAGVGGRWTLRRGEGLAVAVGSALIWERERLDLRAGDPHPARTSEARLSTYLNLQAGGRRGASLAATACYQPALPAMDDARFLGTMELKARLLGPLTQTTVLDFRVDTGRPWASGGRTPG